MKEFLSIIIKTKKKKERERNEKYRQCERIPLYLTG
jgi:hypothetical protein